jgi:glutamate--cysteine ligase
VVRETIQSLFRPSRPEGPLRIGLEAEVIPIRASDGRPVLPQEEDGQAGTVTVLHELAESRGWRQEDTDAGVPRYHLGHGAVLTYEPGGQLELATAAHPSLDAADREVRDILLRLADAMDGHGIRLLSRGVDPRTPLSEARLVLGGDRYPRQRAHYDRRGPEGRVMMLQSAAVHLNLDLGPQPVEAWDAANALAPLLTAVFANAPTRCGEGVAHRSHRAALWRRLDPSRTGVFPSVGDPTPRYMDFALRADSFLLGEPGSPPRSFLHWLEAGASRADLRRHLTTLFPEVRPRGYLELRSVDALPARWCIVPAAVAFALVHHPPTRRRLLRTLPPPDLLRLERAGRLGLRDPGLRQEAEVVQALTLEGLAGLGRDVAGPAIVRRVEDFFLEFTSRGRDPGDRPEEAVVD